LKNIFKISICLAICFLFASCVQTPVSVTPTIQDELTITPTPSIIPTSTANPDVEVYPTLIPTIAPSELPEMLKKITLENINALNGHNMRKITGWSNGFNRGVWSSDKEGYQWMDSSHLLLYPVVGEKPGAIQKFTDTRPIVINIDSGNIWLPPLDQPSKLSLLQTGTLPYWSPTLGILVTSQVLEGGYATTKGVSTFNANGDFVARYWGDFIDISPSGTKILIADDSWVDLKTGKIVDFNWYFGSRPRWRPIWSADETRVYICCYFYGNATTGESYYLSDEDTILDGHPDNNLQSLHHSHGVWLNDNFVLAQFDGVQTYRDGFLPIFDISARTFRNLGALANLPDEFNTMPYVRPNISPNRDYMWISPGLQSATDPQVYLVDLKTLKSQLYHSSSVDWSANGEYAMLNSQVLNLSNKELRPIPPYPNYRYYLDDDWHPTEGVFGSIRASENRQTQTLFIHNVENMTLSQVALPPIFSSGFLRPMIFWSPKGDHIALLAADNSLWQIDYPELKNIEQLTPPMPDSKDIMWSSDGAYLSLISGVDIYIVDTRDTP
jgi:hypothetical protein